MNKLTILEAIAVEREGSFTNDAGDKVEYSTRKQPGKLEVGGFAYPFDVRLEKDQKPWPLGEYTVDWDAMVTMNKGVPNFSKYAVLRPVGVIDQSPAPRPQLGK